MRMRELLEGRNKSLADQKLLQWDASELDGSASVLQPEDLEEIIEDSTSASKGLGMLPRAAAAGGNLGPVSPGLASRAMTAPEKGAAKKLAAEDDFEGGQTTDVEAQKFSRGSSGGDKKPEPPPRKVITPPGLRAGGAPLDPLPHERDLPRPVTSPPPTAPSKRFTDAPTVLVPDPSPAPSGRFAEVATVIDGHTPRPGPAPSSPPPNRTTPQGGIAPQVMPPTGQTDQLQPSDLIDVVSMPSAEQAFAGNPYYQHLAEGGEPRKFPPWLLGVMFVVVLALATGITVALARALS